MLLDAAVPGFNLGVDDADGRTVVLAEGELDGFTAPLLRETLHGLVGDHVKLVIDLAGVTFLDSTALGVLLGAQQQLEARGGNVVLRGPTSSVRRVLEVTGLETAFVIG